MSSLMNLRKTVVVGDAIVEAGHEAIISGKRLWMPGSCIDGVNERREYPSIARPAKLERSLDGAIEAFDTLVARDLSLLLYPHLETCSR
jgi:hypothetical protein